MLFNTIQFFVFLAVVLAGFYASPPGWRKWLLLVASYFFYGCWNWRFIPFLLILTAIDYTAGLWITRTRPSRKKAVLIASLSANLIFLGFFKYYNFLASSVAWTLGMPLDAFALAIVLPVGISFHTLQSMSYVVDVYRGEEKAVTNPLDYALFICFFPQLVAGPIVRARYFFRDLFNWKPPTGEHISEGILMVTLGLTKKMAFADQFAKIADAYFRNTASQPGMLTAWCGSAAFAIQVYFDFSGYTDIAIGCAKMLGFHFPVNFRRPFLAFSTGDLWHRWHITLSTWLRDYVYIALGGNRGGELKTYRNLFLTMLAGGLWHGANWNYVLWGGYNGVLLAVERFLRGGKPEGKPRWFLYPFQCALTIGLFVVGLAMFRAQGVRDGLHVISEMFTGAPGTLLFKPWHLGLAGMALMIAAAEEKTKWFDWVVRGPRWAYASAMAMMLLCLELFAVTDIAIPFVYFQF